jgi:HAD superfamily hydrolase (TIGR01509 family)
MITLPFQPSAVIFDMDGLIFDTEALYRDAVMAAAAENLVEMPLSLYLSTIGLSGDATQTLLSRHFEQDFNFEAFWTSATRHFHIMSETQLRLKPGVVELLDFLDDAELPLAIATSSSHRDVQHHLATHGLLERFKTIVAREDYHLGKPHPDPFLKAASLLEVAPQLCLALEDSHNGVRAASRAGMMTVMVPDLVEPTNEIRQLCVGVARDLHEVLPVITARRIDHRFLPQNSCR